MYDVTPETPVRVLDDVYSPLPAHFYSPCLFIDINHLWTKEDVSSIILTFCSYAISGRHSNHHIL